MLGSLRERLFSRSPIRSVTTDEKSRRSSERREHAAIDDHDRDRNRRRSDAGSSHTSSGSAFSLDAGSALLDKSQSDWTRLHDLSEESAKGAERVDVAIEHLVRRCYERREVMTSLVLQLASLPALKDAVWQLTARLVALESGFADVERLLLTFEDTIEIQRLQEKQLEERFQLALYKERKMSHLEAFKEKLAAECEVRRSAIETQKNLLLRERQDTFGQAFEQEMQHYKQHGRVEKVLVRVGSVEETGKEQEEHRLRLEDIELEQEEDDALDTFLASQATEDSFAEQDGDVGLIRADDESTNESSATEPE